MDDHPKISIVIPSYNQGEYIERTLRSVIDQGYDNTEIIVIDGGSDDGTVDILKSYEDHIAFWVSELDRGQAHALNKGFARATGDIFGWQNSDDVYMPGAFSAAVSVFSDNLDVAVVYGNWYEIDGDDRIIDRTYSAPRARVPHFPYEGFDAYNQTMFWRRGVHERFGSFDESLHMLMDGDMIFRFIFNEAPEAFRKIDRFLAAFRRHGGQKSPDDRLTATTRNNERMLSKKFGFPPKSSLRGIVYRLRHRLAKLRWHVVQGGVRYTWRKFMQGYRKRGGIL